MESIYGPTTYIHALGIVIFLYYVFNFVKGVLRTDQKKNIITIQVNKYSIYQAIIFILHFK